MDKTTNTVVQCTNKYFNMKLWHHSGILLKEKLAKKVRKLLHKQTRELEKMLIKNLNDVEELNGRSHIRAASKHRFSITHRAMKKKKRVESDF